MIKDLNLSGRPLAWLILLTALLHLGGCASPYILDYQSGRNFASLKTFELATPAPGSQGAQSLADQRVAAILQTQLPQRGLTPSQTPDNADVRVTWRYEPVTEIVNQGFTWGFGYGLGVGARSAVGVQLDRPVPSEARPREKLVLEMVDPATQAIIWSATARSPLPLDSDPKAREETLSELIQAMLEDFPPT